MCWLVWGWFLCSCRESGVVNVSDLHTVLCQSGMTRRSLSNYFIHSSLCWLTASAAWCILNGIWKLCILLSVTIAVCYKRSALWTCEGSEKLVRLSWVFWDECTVTWEYFCFHPRPWSGRASWHFISLTPSWLMGTCGTTDWTSFQSISGTLLRSMALLTPRLW